MNNKQYAFLMKIIEDLAETDTKLLPSELELILTPLQDKNLMELLVLFYSAGAIQKHWHRPASP